MFSEVLQAQQEVAIKNNKKSITGVMCRCRSQSNKQCMTSQRLPSDRAVRPDSNTVEDPPNITKNYLQQTHTQQGRRHYHNGKTTTEGETTEIQAKLIALKIEM